MVGGLITTDFSLCWLSVGAISVVAYAAFLTVKSKGP